MTVGNARGFNAPRIADDDFGAVFPGFDHPAGDDWMGVGAVVAKDQQAFRVFDVADRVAHRPVAQRLLQPGDRGAVADAGAAVDVIGVQHRAGELLHHIVGFVAGAARGAGGHDGARAMLLFDLPELAGGIANRLLPADRREGAAFLVADHRLFETGRQELRIVKKIPAVVAFQAQLVLVGDAVGGFRANDFIVVDNQFKFATRPAVGAHARDFFHQ